MDIDTQLQDNVKSALKRSSYGQLKYDRNWEEEGRGRGIADDIYERLCSIPITPKENGHRYDCSFDRYESEPINYQMDCHSPRNNCSQNFLPQKSLHSNCSSFSDSIAPRDVSNHFDGSNGQSPNSSEIHVSNFLNRLKKIQEDSAYESPSSPPMSSRIASLTEEIDLVNQYSDAVGSYDESNDIDEKVAQVQQKSQKLKAEKEASDRRKSIVNELTMKFDHCIRSAKNALDENKRDNEEYKRFASAFFSQISAFRHLFSLSHPSDQDVKSLRGLVEDVAFLCNNTSESARNLAAKIDHEIAEAKAAKAEAEKLAKLAQEEEKKQQLQQQASSNKQPETRKLESTPLNLPKAPVKSLDPFSCPPESLFFHKQIQLRQFEESLKEFTQDQGQKSYRSDLTLFLKININNIATGSSDVLRQKFRILCDLFDGRNVPFRNSSINCQRHPLALKFCYFTAVNTFIAATPKQLIDVPQAAFSLSSVITLLWCRHEQFGQLFLAVLYKKCPYIAGYYPERQPDDTEASYRELCGYTITAGSIEAEESFLNRMRSFVKLYAGIVQSTPQMNHPHGLKFGWAMLARTLNTEPVAGITPAVLYAFFSVATYRMVLLYKRQFFKILIFLQKDYLARIEGKTTSNDNKPALEQLRLLIKELMKKIDSGRMNEIKPQGIIPEYFWQNSYLNSR